MTAKLIVLISVVILVGVVVAQLPPPSRSVGYTMGNPAAPVVLEMFADLECIYCGGSYPTSMLPLLSSPLTSSHLFSSPLISSRLSVCNSSAPVLTRNVSLMMDLIPLVYFLSSTSFSPSSSPFLSFHLLSSRSFYW